jgi:acyl-CoA dehydrogenase
MSAAFALVADATMILVGAALKRRESLSARLGDVLSHLYLTSAALKRFEDQARPEADLPLVRWACEEHLFAAEERLDAVLRNLPNRVAASVLRAMAFPLGRSARKPSDRLTHKVAAVVLEPSTARDRLTVGVYVPKDPSEAVARLDLALEKVAAADAVEKKLRAAIQHGVLRNADDPVLLSEAVALEVITPRAAEVVAEAAAIRREVIQVDDFAPEYLFRDRNELVRKTAANR